MHPRSESDYNATEAAEISRARIVRREPTPGHGAPKLNTQKRLWSCQRLPNMARISGFARRAAAAAGTPPGCKNALYSRLILVKNT